MYIRKVLSYNGAWERFKKNHTEELTDFLTSIDVEILVCHESNSFNVNYDQSIKMQLLIRDNLKDLGWIEDYYRNSDSPFSDRGGYIGGLGYIKNRLSVKEFFNEEDTLIWAIKDVQENYKLKKIDIGVQYIIGYDYYVKDIFYFERILKLLKSYKGLSFEAPFLIFELGFKETEIEFFELDSDSIKIERSIEFKPEHYQAGLGILNYFGTVMRKKYPEQNAKVRIEQDDNTVRLVVESANGDKEVIERAFDEFGLVIHRDMQPEHFYDNYLDVAELKTKLGTFESELKFQHQLVEMKEHRIIELKKDKEFLESVIGKALVRPNSPIYINNQLTNSQSTVINHKAELAKSTDDLEELIDLADSDALKNKLAMIQNALENNRNSENPDNVKDSNGMKKLAKFLKEANEVGTEANSLAEKGGKALELIKSLGRSYNSIAQWCGMPVIPNVFVKE